MPVVLGGNQLDTAAYDVSNSLRFNDNDSSSLTRTMGTPTSTRTFTYAAWLKRSNTNIQTSFLSWGGSTYATDFRYESSTDSLYFFFDDNAGWYAKTIAKYRDVAAWYHVVLAVDTTQATESNRVKLYVNGTQYGPALDGTDWTQHEIFGQNYDFPELANGQTMAIGKRNSSGSHFFDGYMSEVYFIDGQALDSSYFGETNDNGVWIPKEYSGTYGNNGFLLEFKQTGGGTDSSGRGADTSGNDNHFANNNFDTYDTTTDTPTNNFATLNPLSNSLQASYQEGNLEETCNDNFGCGATQSFANGKWYWEVKIKAGDYNIPGVANSDEQYRFPETFGINNYSITYYGLNGVIYKEGSTNQTTGTTFGANDIIGLAVDMDSGTRTVQFYKNGSTVGSAVTLPTNWIYTVPMIRKGGSSQTTSFNFGNPAFSISSGNSDANGYGNFEYAVPSGYYALCTKNLAEFG